MTPNVYDAMYAYAKQAITKFYLGAKTAVLYDPKLVEVNQQGQTAVREVAGPNLGNYTGSYATSGAKRGGYNRITPVIPDMDRGLGIVTDTVAELDSYLAGQKSSINAMLEDSLNRNVPAEFDARNMAGIFSAIPDLNITGILPGDQDLSVDNIIDVLADYEAKIFDAGYEGDTFLFIASDIYANLQKAVASKNGLMNGSVLKETTMTVTTVTDLSKFSEMAEDALKVTVTIARYGKFIVIEMPKDRMYTELTIFDGQSAGQELGGYDAADGAGNIKLMFVPMAAAVAFIRHQLVNLLIPASALPAGGDVEILSNNRKVYGPLEIENAGINQLSDSYQYNARFVGGRKVFDNRKDTIFAVVQAGTPGGLPETAEVAVDDEITLTAPGYFGYLISELTIASSSTANATIVSEVNDHTGVLTIKVTGVAEGSSNITVSANGVQLAKSTVTVTA